MFGVLDISASALTAQRTNIDVIAGNIAMRDATRKNAAGESVPYRRRVPLFAPGQPSAPNKAGVRIAEIAQDPSAFGKRWAPEDVGAVKTGPDAGYVRTSNVDYHTEMVNAMTAVRAYEANVTVIEVAKSMATTSLRLLA